MRVCSHNDVSPGCLNGPTRIHDNHDAEAIRMLQLDYLNRLRAMIDDLEAHAAETDAAAETIVESLIGGGKLFISPLGHGNDGDLLHRAGGLVAAQPFRYSFGITDKTGNTSRERPRDVEIDPGLEQARCAVKCSRMRGGDCVILGSVSGRSVAPISLAIAANEIGATTIGITSVGYSAEIEPIHSCGKNLGDVCDIVIDNHVPYGDASLDVEGLEERVVPISGVTTIMICWMIKAQIIEKLLERGRKPSHYISGNRPDGPEFNRAMEKQFDEQGF